MLGRFCDTAINVLYCFFVVLEFKPLLSYFVHF